jgi:long-chain acyl-CoA synthetase
MLRAFRDGDWRSIRWGAFARQVAAAARGLLAAGIAAGDRVLITSENRPEYPIAETALMSIRAVPVPAYVTNTIDDYAHLLRDSGARAALVSTRTLAAKVQEAAQRAGSLDLLVCMDGPSEVGAGLPRVLSWSELAAQPDEPEEIARGAAEIPTATLACLLYTSGTGGAPKGVMLPHRSLLSNCASGCELLRPMRLRDEVYLSYLPTAHAYEHLVGLFLMPSLGAEVVYGRGAEHLSTDLVEVRPTVLTAVPRVLEVMRTRVLNQVAREAPWRRKLFHKAVAIGLKRLDDALLTAGERLAEPLLDRLVGAKVRARFGGQLKGVMSGGARLDPELGRFFLALGLRIMQGYGQTEAGPVISANPPDAIRIETVGKPLRGVEVRIAEDGEILVRGDLVMDGYWRRPAETRAAIRDGWLHTGDLGVLDADGYLRITDRKKDIIVLLGGENVSPAKVEEVLMAEPEVAQAVVTGDGRAGLTGLLVPAEGEDGAAVARALARANRRLSVTERVRKHAIVPPFTVENGLLTPSQKIRRSRVIRANAEALERLHG